MFLIDIVRHKAAFIPLSFLKKTFTALSVKNSRRFDISRRYKFSGIKQGNWFQNQAQSHLTFVIRTGRGRVIYSHKQTARKIESPKNLSQAAVVRMFSCGPPDGKCSIIPLPSNCFCPLLPAAASAFSWGSICLSGKGLCIWNDCPWNPWEGRGHWPLGRLISILNACSHLQRILFSLITGCLIYVFTKHISVETRQLEFFRIIQKRALDKSRLLQVDQFGRKNKAHARTLYS